MKRLRVFSKGENKVCVFTGHRTLGEDFCSEKLFEVIRNAVKRGVTTFLCGMAVGFDLLAAEFVLALREQNPAIRFVACIPCEGQNKYYSEDDKLRYRTAIVVADETVVLSDHYYNGCMHARNQYMVDRADVMIAYCKHEQGGTAYTVRYFQKMHPNGEIIFL